MKVKPLIGFCLGALGLYLAQTLYFHRPLLRIVAVISDGNLSAPRGLGWARLGQPKELDAALKSPFVGLYADSKGNASEEAVRMLLALPLLAAVSLTAPVDGLCTLQEPNPWTLRLASDTLTFTTLDAHTVKLASSETRFHACDVPGSVLIVRSGLLRPLAAQVKKLGRSALFLLALRFKGRLAYLAGAPAPAPNCLGLPLPFSVQFIFIPKLTGKWKLEVEGRGEFWLGCVWDSASLEARLPLACPFWLRVFMMEVTRIFKSSFNVPYRLGFGSVLGLVRDRDVIGWTKDVDLILPGVDKGFKGRYLAEMGPRSGGLYSGLDRNGKPDVPPFRAFRACPMAFPNNSWFRLTLFMGSTKRRGGFLRFDVDEVAMKERMGQVSHGLICSSHDTSWQAGGYVDLYDTGVHFSVIGGKHTCDITMRQYYPKCLGNLSKPVGRLSAFGSTFDTIHSPESYVRCLYGPKWQLRPPKTPANRTCYSNENAVGK